MFYFHVTLKKFTPHFYYNQYFEYSQVVKKHVHVSLVILMH